MGYLLWDTSHGMSHGLLWDISHGMSHGTKPSMCHPTADMMGTPWMNGAYHGVFHGLLHGWSHGNTTGYAIVCPVEYIRQRCSMLDSAG